MIDESNAVPSSLLREMTILRSHRSKRVSSYDRSGGNRDWIELAPGETATLATLSGPGCINRLYVILRSLDAFYLRKLVLRAFWDGEATPSVEVPFGDYFGNTNGKLCYFSSLALAVNPGGYGPNAADGFNCFLPMPFESSARIELENQGDMPVPRCWYHIDYEEMVSLSSDVGRLHAQWRRENPTVADPQPPGHWAGKNITGRGNYVVLDAAGRGNFVGFVLGVDNSCGDWWGEGDDMIFIDGEGWPPSLHGTGTEEIFGGGACPNVPYAGAYMGIHQISDQMWAGKNGMYRFFVNDPIRFERSIRVTIEHGHNNDLANDYTSVAFWYQREPHAEFPPLAPMSQRIPFMPPEYWTLVQRERALSEQYFELSKRLPDKERRIIAVQYQKPVFEALHREDYPAATAFLSRFQDALTDFAQHADTSEAGEGGNL